MKLYPHQVEFLKENPDKAILAWEMRTGKTLPASKWIDHPSRAGNTLIITPKANKQDWVDLDTRATVYTKEEFKKARKTIKNTTAIVVDEAHYFASPLFMKGRSQLATALYTLVQEYPDMHVLLLTATPIRQDAWSLHTLLCYIGVYYPWKEWRADFFHLVRLPFLRFPAWMPRTDWRIKIREPLEKHCNIVSMHDVVEYLPPIEPIFIKIKQPPYTLPKDKVTTWIDENLHEQNGKAKEIVKLGYRKIVIIVHYTQQIDSLKKELEKDKPVFVLDGRTKNASKTKLEAQEADDCYFIVQSSMAFGWDGWMFSAMVFASMSHSCVDHTQALGRIRHLKYLKSMPVIYLLGGRWDDRIFKCIEMGKKFNPHIYLGKNAS